MKEYLVPPLNLPLNITTSAKAIQERFRKLYRILYVSFLKDDFVHQKDFNLFAQQLDAKLKTIEANIAAGDAAGTASLAAAVAAIDVKVALPHTTTAPGSPTVPNPAQVIPTPPAPPAPAPTTPTVKPDIAFLEQRGAELLAEGPATAPLGDGPSREALDATLKAQESTIQLA